MRKAVKVKQKQSGIRIKPSGTPQQNSLHFTIDRKKSIEGRKTDVLTHPSVHQEHYQ